MQYLLFATLQTILWWEIAKLLLIKVNFIFEDQQTDGQTDGQMYKPNKNNDQGCHTNSVNLVQKWKKEKSEKRENMQKRERVKK